MTDVTEWGREPAAPPRKRSINGAWAVPSELIDHLWPGMVEDLLPRIPDNSVDCILADPDYNIGRRYAGKSSRLPKRDYFQWCEGWAAECLRVLKPTGNLFIINYPDNNAYLRVNFLDPHFARVREYVWVYNTNIGHGRRQFTTAHRSILHCTKTLNNRFYKRAVAQPYQNPEARRERELLARGSLGRMPYSWFYFNLVKNTSRAKTFHSCQIPEALTEMLVKATTRRSDLVLVLFGGSGSELAICKRLGRSFIAAEKNPAYVELIEARLENGGEIPARFRLPANA